MSTPLCIMMVPRTLLTGYAELNNVWCACVPVHVLCALIFSMLKSF